MKKVSKILSCTILAVLCLSLLAVFSFATSTSVSVKYLKEDGSTQIGESQSYTTLSDAFCAAEEYISSYNANEENVIKIDKAVLTLDTNYIVSKSSAETVNSFGGKYELDLGGNTLTVANGKTLLAGFSSESELSIVGNGIINIEADSALANLTSGVFEIVGDDNITVNNFSSKQPITYSSYSTLYLENATINQRANATLFNLGGSAKANTTTFKNVTVNAEDVNSASLIILSQKDTLNLENVTVNAGPSPELITVKNTAALNIKNSKIETSITAISLYNKATLDIDASELRVEHDRGIVAYGENKVNITDCYVNTGSDSFVSVAMPVDSSATEDDKNIPISEFNIENTIIYTGGAAFVGASHFNVNGGYFWWNKDGGKSLFFRTEEYSENEGVKRGVLIHCGTTFSKTIGDSNAMGGYAYTFSKYTVDGEELDATLIINDSYRYPYVVAPVGSPREGAIAWLDPITFDNPGDTLEDIPKLGIIELAYNYRLDKTNGFYRHYFKDTYITDNITLFQKRFYLAAESNRYGKGPEEQYALENIDYITIDFDISTDTSYPDDLAISIFPIAKGAPASGVDDAIVIRKNAEGNYNLYRNLNKSEKTYEEIEGAMLSNVPGAWNHITFLLAIEHADGIDKDGNGFEDIKSSSKAYVYIDGNLVGSIAPFSKYSDPSERDEDKKAENALLSTTTHIESIQLSLPTNKNFLAGQSYSIDNLRTVTYYKGYTGGFNVTEDGFAAPEDLTELPESVYNDGYETPISAPLASIGNVAYDSFEDAYEAAGRDDVIVLYDDANDIVIDKKIGGIDTNGHTFTFVSEKWGANEKDGIYTFFYQYEPSYVQFFDLEGNLAYSDFLANGSNAIYAKADTLNAFAQKDGAYYAFLGWSSTKDGEILDSLKVSGDETRFYANYDYNARVACVTIDNASGKIIGIYTEDDDLSVSDIALSISSGTTIKLLKDIDINSAVIFPSNVRDVAIDVNGYTLRSTDKSAIFKLSGGSDIHFYSSREGGVIMNGYIGAGLITAKSGDTVNMGSYKEYSGDNLTVQFSSFNYFNKDYTLNLNGGTYVRSQNWHSGMFLVGAGTVININGAVLYTGSDAPIYFVFGDGGGAVNNGAEVNIDNSVFLETVGNKSGSDNLVSFGTSVNCTVSIKNSILAPDVDYKSNLGTNKILLGENVGFIQKVDENYQNYTLSDGLIFEHYEKAVSPNEDGSEFKIIVPIATYKANQTEGTCEYLGYRTNAETGEPDPVVYNVTLLSKTKIATDEDVIYSVIDGEGNEKKVYVFNGSFDLADLSDGATAKLYRDIALKTSSAISGEKSVSIDLNGHMLRVSDTALATFDMFRINDASTLNIYSSVAGGKIVNAVVNGSVSAFATSKAVVNVAGSGAVLNIGKYGEYSADNMAIYSGTLVNVSGSASVNILGGSYYKNLDTSTSFIALSGAANMNISDALIAVTDNVSAANASIFNITGNETDGKISRVNVNNCSVIYAGSNKDSAYLVSSLNKGSEISISSSILALKVDIKTSATSLGNGKVYLAPDNKLSSLIDDSVTIDELKTVSPTEAVPYEYTFIYNQYDKTSDNQYIFNEYSVKGELGYAITEILIDDNTTYTVVQGGAVSAFTTPLDLSTVPSGATVVLYKDIALLGSVIKNTTADIYLDLAGHSITNASGESIFKLTSGGELHIYSSKAGAKITSTSTGALISLDASNAKAYVGAFGEHSGDNITYEGMYVLISGETATAEAPVSGASLSLNGGIYLKTVGASTNPDFMFDIREFADTAVSISDATVAVAGGLATTKGYIFNVLNGNTTVNIEASNVLYMGSGRISSRAMLFNKLASGSKCTVSDSVLYVNMRITNADDGAITLGANCLVGYIGTTVPSTIAFEDGYVWSTTIPETTVTVDEVGFSQTFTMGTVEE